MLALRKRTTHPTYHTYNQKTKLNNFFFKKPTTVQSLHHGNLNLFTAVTALHVFPFILETGSQDLTMQPWLASALTM